MTRGRYTGQVYEVRHLDRSPLSYHRSGEVQRLFFFDSTAPTPLDRDVFFAETYRKIYYGKNNRRLKKPRIEVTPGAATGTVAFLDYHEYGDWGIYVDYMKTRLDYRGRGLARRLIDELVLANPTVKYLHFGRLLNPTIGKIYDDAEASYKGKISFIGHKDYKEK